MDIELLRTFLEVKETRHFGRASEKLFLTQAAVSSRIRQLESILGTSLFTRYRNNIQLTPSGERLIHHAEAILEAWKQAKMEIQSQNESATTLKIGTSPGIWDTILHNYIDFIYDEIPNLALNAEVQSTDQLTRKLIERELDLALVYDPPKADELKSEIIFSLNLIFVCSKADCSSIEEAYQEGYIKVDWGSHGNSQQSCALSSAPTPTLQTSQSSLAIRYLLTRGGCCYLSEPSVNCHLGSTLFPVKSAPPIFREVYAVARKDYPRDELLSRITRLMKSGDYSSSSSPSKS